MLTADELAWKEGTSGCRRGPTPGAGPAAPLSSRWRPTGRSRWEAAFISFSVGRDLFHCSLIFKGRMKTHCRRPAPWRRCSELACPRSPVMEQSMPRPELVSALTAAVTLWGPRGQPLPVHTEEKTAEDKHAAPGRSESRAPCQARALCVLGRARGFQVLFRTRQGISHEQLSAGRADSVLCTN